MSGVGWHMQHDTIEDVQTNTLHRPHCPDAPADGKRWAAREITEARDVALHERDRCRPDVIMHLGAPDHPTRADWTAPARDGLAPRRSRHEPRWH